MAEHRSLSQQKIASELTTNPGVFQAFSLSWPFAANLRRPVAATGRPARSVEYEAAVALLDLGLRSIAALDEALARVIIGVRRHAPPLAGTGGAWVAIKYTLKIAGKNSGQNWGQFSGHYFEPTV